VFQDVLLRLSAAGGFLGALLIAASAPVSPTWAPSWRLTVPGISHPGSLLAAGLFVAGLVLLGGAWIGLVGACERLQGTERRRLAIVVAVTVLWTIPVLLGPPLLSNDVYSYAAQGEMAARGIDPTAAGPAALGQGDFLRAVDPVWMNAPAPYGPLWIAAGNGVVRATGHDLAASVWLFRCLIVVGVIMAGFGVVSIARSCGGDSPCAVACAFANPLVILHLIGGCHNDGLMMGFLCLGVAAAATNRRAPAVVLIALAVAVKLPATVGLLMCGWVWAGAEAPFRERVWSIAKVVVVAAAIVAGLCAAAGIGVGWITAMKNTGKNLDTFSLMTMLGFAVTSLLNLVGLSDNPEIAVAPARFLGLLGGIGVSYWLMTRATRIGLPRAIGLCLSAVMLLGPVLLPWYLPAGFALIAASGFGRFRPVYMTLALAVSALVWPVSVSAPEFFFRYQRILSFILILIIATAVVVVQRMVARRHRGGRGLHVA